VESLPIAPTCALDTDGLRRQRDRYRCAGQGARLVRRTPRDVVFELDGDADLGNVEQLIAVERECCPFFAFEWDAGSRRLSVAVSAAEQEPALDAVVTALALAP
jgi:hypothetical protein